MIRVESWACPRTSCDLAGTGWLADWHCLLSGIPNAALEMLKASCLEILTQRQSSGRADPWTSFEQGMQCSIHGLVLLACVLQTLSGSEGLTLSWGLLSWCHNIMLRIMMESSTDSSSIIALIPSSFMLGACHELPDWLHRLYGWQMSPHADILKLKGCVADRSGDRLSSSLHRSSAVCRLQRLKGSCCSLAS